jgi:4-hydroxybenzoate polyprenyltransferase
MKKILDHIFFLRPLLILPIWTIAILGARAANLHEMASPFKIANISESLPQIFWMLLWTTFLYGAVYIYNQIHDIESDRMNGKLFFLADNIVSVSAAYVMWAILTFLAVVWAFSINTTMGVLFLIVAVLGILYSHPKTNFKGKSGKALWSNMFGCGTMPFLIGWAMAVGSISMAAVLKSLPYLAAVGAIYFNTTLPDRKGDEESGKETYAVIWSVGHVVGSALLRLVIAIIFALMAGDYAVLLAAGVALPFFIRAVSSKQISDSMIATQVAILLLAVMACIYFPPYILLVAVSILATKAYYKWRFNFAYPRLKV